jgi:Rad3-related DNA helicase
MAGKLQIRKKSSYSIFDFFSGTPRQQQQEILSQVEEYWDSTDVFVIEASVAVGKSRVAMCIASWASKVKGMPANILTPQNILVDQYKKDFPNTFILEKKEKQRCRAYIETTPHKEGNCSYHHKVTGEHCPDCPYIKRVKQAHKVAYMVCNNHVYLAHKLYKPVAIFDECHNILKLMQDLCAKKLWGHDYLWPSTLSSYGQFRDWVEKHEARETDKNLKAIWDCLSTGNMRYLVELGTEEYRGEDSPVLKLLPLDVSNEKPLLWPSKGKNGVQKVVLMSATVNEVDIAALGLDKRRIRYIKTGSPIPVENRPVVVRPILNMSMAGQEQGIPALMRFVEQQQDITEGKGIVHVTYSVAEQLRAINLRSTIKFHDRNDKSKAYFEWRESHPEEKQVLIASGFDEGIDLAGPEFTWQVIGKVKFPSLEEPVWRHCLMENPSRYYWETLRSLIQATGRICRTPNDYGITFIVDKQFNWLYSEGMRHKLLPAWFQEGLIFDLLPEDMNDLQGNQVQCLGD